MFNVVLLVLSQSTFLEHSVAADDPPITYQVVNRTTQPRFTVVNKTTPVRGVMKEVFGCVCSQNGSNCRAGFCKANGGSGCPNCPIAGVKLVEYGTTTAAPNTTTSILPSSMYGDCPSGNCPTSNSRPLLFPNLRRWR